MGLAKSKNAKKPEVGKAGDFYWACRNGEYRKVQTMLSGMTYEELNRIEPNGSTALHAATYGNHLGIVKLLLERNCARTTLNRFGHAAHEEAQTEEMRAFFLRPISTRFVDEDPLQSFGLPLNSKDNVDIEDGVPDDWLKIHSDKSEAEEASFMNAIARAPALMRKVLQRRLEDECKALFEEFVSDHVNHSDEYHHRVKNLLDQFKTKKSIEALLTLYTLQTPIYSALQEDCEAFTALIYLHLPQLSTRAYRGITYRGGRMSDEDLNAYRWVLDNQNRVLETRTFQSMSKEKKTALEFADIPRSQKPLSVLLIFDFPETCKTAIDLTKISSDIQGLSEYPHEQEVTLLPFTLFKVREIKIDTQTKKHYRITLENVPVQKQSITGAWLQMM